MAIMVDSASRCCFVISCKISHFGTKPKVGGSPPRAIRVIIVDAANVGVFSHEVESLLIFVECVAIIIINMEEVNIK